MSSSGICIAAKASAKSIDAIPAGASDRLVSDAVIDNLYLFVTPRGGKSWRWIARLKTGETRKISLGKWPAHSLAIARERAQECNAARDRGNDPRELKAREREASEKARADTIAASLDAWFADKLRNREAVRSLREYRGIWDRYMPLAWREKPVSTLTLSDVKAALDALKERGITVQANRWLQLIKQFLDWCEVHERVTRNVARPLKPAVEDGRGSRGLSVAELALAYRATNALPDDERDVARLMILTGCRRREAIGAAATEYCDGVWTLPVERSKSHRPHPMTLGREGRAIFDRRADRRWLFTASDPQAWDHKYLGDRLIAAMEALSGEPVARFTVHGIRKGVGTAICSDEMDAMGEVFTPETVEVILNHAVPRLQRIYNASRYQRLIGRALGAWEKLLLQEVAKQSGENVVPLRAMKQATR